MLTSEVLDLAADEIERRGWVGPDTYTEDPWGLASESAPLCLEGGIMAAAGCQWISVLPRCDAYQAVRAYLGSGVRTLYNWNDAAGRTQEQVIAVLRAASAVESARESQPAAVSA